MCRRLLAVLTVAVALLPAIADDAVAAPFAGLPCNLERPAGSTNVSLGPVDRATFPVPATGTVNAVMLFVDFSDGVHDEETSVGAARIARPAEAYFRAASHGRMRLQVTAVDGWFRMPLPVAAYDPRTFDGQRLMLQHAMDAADAVVDFRPYGIVYVVAAGRPPEQLSQAYIAGSPDFALTADGVKILLGATFGSDVEAGHELAGMVVVHESGHLFGLPDLYARDVDYHRFVGSWDPMGNLFHGTSFSGWVQRTLGWLPAARVVCLRAPRTTAINLVPLTRASGASVVVVPTTRFTAVVAEVRVRAGVDRGLCDAGLIVYFVDTRLDSGAGPMRIVPARRATNACGTLGAAAFSRGAGERCSVVTRGVRVEVVAVTAGTYRVRVRRASAARDPRVAACR